MFEQHRIRLAGNNDGYGQGSPGASVAGSDLKKTVWKVRVPTHQKSLADTGIAPVGETQHASCLPWQQTFHRATGADRQRGRRLCHSSRSSNQHSGHEPSRMRAN